MDTDFDVDFDVDFDRLLLQLNANLKSSVFICVHRWLKLFYLSLCLRAFVIG